MKTILLTLLAASLALAGCTNTSESADDTGPTAKTGGGGSEVHGTVEVTNNSGPTNSSANRSTVG